MAKSKKGSAKKEGAKPKAEKRARAEAAGEAAEKKEVPAIDLDALRKLSTEELRALHLEVFGQEVKIRHRDYLFKRLAFWVQERQRSEQRTAHGDGVPSRVGK